MSVLIACIGNIFKGDDGFGCEVARALFTKPLGGDVRVVDFGIRGLDLTYALLEHRELTILVDAVSRGGEPGTLYTIEPEFEGSPAAQPTALEAHDINPLSALRTARAMGTNIGRVLLLGCEPADLGGEDGRMGLTPLVSAAVPEAVALVERLAAAAALPSYDSYEHSQA